MGSEFDGDGCWRIAKDSCEILVGLIDVDADADDEEPGKVLVGLHLGENADKLFAAQEDIVRPFDLGMKTILVAESFDESEGRN